MSQMFPEYQLITQLVKQPQSNLYLAQSAIHNEKVIIKSFNAPPIQSEQEHERFLQEIACFKQLRHPHILPVLDGGINEHPYIVSAYAAAGSLQQRLDGSEGVKRLSFQDALGIVMQVGHALSYAHERDILHTRVKPENVLFDADGHALLADFRLPSLDSFLNSTIRPYTREACYIAPERFSGALSREADQYGLGCLAYELFTGQSPFMAAALATWQHTYASMAEPTPFAQRMPEVPEYVSVAILKALSKDPARRHASVDSFLKALVEVPSTSVSMEQATPVEEQRAVLPIVEPSGTEKVSSAPTKDAAARFAADAEVHAALTRRVLQASNQVAQLRMPPSRISRRRFLHGKQLWAAIAAAMFVLSGVILAISLFHASHAQTATTQMPRLVATVTPIVQSKQPAQQRPSSRSHVQARTRSVPHAQPHLPATFPGRSALGNPPSTGSSAPAHHTPAVPVRPRPQPSPTRIPTQPPVVPTPVPTQPPVAIPSPTRLPMPTPVPTLPPSPTQEPVPTAPPHAGPGPAARLNKMLAEPNDVFVRSLLHDCYSACRGRHHAARRRVGMAIVTAVAHWFTWASNAS